MANAIGNLGTIPTITVSNRVFTDLTTLIILYGRIVTSGRYATLRLANGTAGYPVTTAKTLTIRAGRVVGTSAASGEGNLLYGNTDVGFDSASAPTTPIYLAGDATNTVRVGFGTVGTGGATSADGFAIDFAVPATKFPAVQLTGGNSSAIFYGYEA